MIGVDLIQPWKTGTSKLVTVAPRLLKDERIVDNPKALGLKGYIESSSHDAHSQPTGSVWFVLEDKDIYTIAKSDFRYDLAQEHHTPSLTFHASADYDQKTVASTPSFTTRTPLQ
jgi:hypothetical protein